MKWATKEGYVDMETLRVFIVADTISELPVPLEDTTWSNVSVGTVEGVIVNGVTVVDFDGPVDIADGDNLEVIFDGRFTIE